jgi:hypothetical protein
MEPAGSRQGPSWVLLEGGLAAPGKSPNLLNFYGVPSRSQCQQHRTERFQFVWRKAARIKLDGNGETHLGAYGRKIEKWITRSKSAEMKRAAALSREHASPSRADVRRSIVRSATCRTGAPALMLESYIGIPDTFDLVFDHSSVRECLVTWRKATQIGIEFA